MKIRFACPNCGKSHVVDAALAGKKGRCKGCGTVMPIPAAPQPVGAPARTAAVVDPFGLDDGPISTGSAPPPPRGGASDFEEDAGPVPRRVKAKSGKKKGRAGDGPWNLPLRNLAVQAIALALIVSFFRVGLSSFPETRGAAKIAAIIQGVVALLASALTIFSIVGSAVSFAKGNRRAFASETARERALWYFAIGQTVIILGIMVMVVRPGGMARLATLGRSLSTTEKAPIFVYEGIVGSVVSFLEEVAGNFERFPDVDQARIIQLLQEHEANLARAVSTPLPTRNQVKFLRARFEIPGRMAMDHIASAHRIALDRLRARGLDTPEVQSVLAKSEKMAATTDSIRKALDRLGPNDDLEWYLTITSPAAGTKAGDAPAIQPGGVPPEVQWQVDETRRHMGEFQRSFPQPGVGFPGPPAFPQ